MLRLPRHLWLTFPALILFAPVCPSQLAPPAAQTPQASPTLLTAFMRRDTASSAWSADNVSYDFYTFDIYVNDLTKRKTTHLTKDGMSGFPVLSPDGSRIVFLRRNVQPCDQCPPFGSAELIVANSDATNQRPVAVIPSAAYSMFWSPDSKQLAYMVLDSNLTLTGKIYILRADSDDPPALIGPAVNSNIEWSPDSKWIAYQCPPQKDVESPQLCVAQSSDPASAKVLLSSILGPYEWSTDGGHLNFISVSSGAASLATISLNDLQSFQIAALSSVPVAPNSTAMDIRTILEANPFFDLLLSYPLQGGGYKTVINVPLAPPHLDESADGKKILFTDSSEGGSSVFVAASDGSSRRRLTEPKILARDPIWLPNSGQIAFSALDHHDRKVFVTDSGGTLSRVVSPPRYQQCVPDTALPHTTVLFIICGRAAYSPPTRGLFSRRLDAMDNNDRSLFLVHLTNPKLKPQLVVGKIYGKVSIAALSNGQRIQNLDSFAGRN